MAAFHQEPSYQPLQDGFVTVPGGRDNEDRPYILISIPQDVESIHIGPSLKYILSIFSEDSKLHGLTVVMDARKGPWKVARSCIRQVNSNLTNDELGRFIVLRPDAFLDKQRIENCTSTQKDGQVLFVPRSRLYKYIDLSQLPIDVGGHFLFNQESWLTTRIKAEEFYKDIEVVLKDLNEIHMRLLNSHNYHASQIYNVLYNTFDNLNVAKSISLKIIQKGRDLLHKIEYDNRNRKFASESEAMTTPQDILDTIQKIGELLTAARSRQCDIEKTCKDIEKSCMGTKDLTILKDGVVTVTNWILGPAEYLLNSRQKVGYDVSSAEDLRREHEDIEFQCWAVYGTYAQLVHKIDTIIKEEYQTPQQKDLISQKDFMDFVCRSFANRLERRRNILITSLRFFRLVSEYFDKTSEVFDSMVMGNKIGEFSNAGQKLQELQDYQTKLDIVEKELLQQGDKLADMLSIPIKDALGREVPIDYSEDIGNIRDILDATIARRNIFSDSVELQKMTLEQVVCIYGYEKDAEQAVQWLGELLDVILRERSHVGCSVGEIQAQKVEQQMYEDTARCTYNYGLQLLNASASLRNSCKLLTDDHLVLLMQLKDSWHTFFTVSQEQITRLRVSAVFHRSVEDQINRLRDLREAVATMPLMAVIKKQVRIKHFFVLREKLMIEVGRMVRLGKLLRSRLKEPLNMDDRMSDNTLTSSSTSSPVPSHQYPITTSPICPPSSPIPSPLHLPDNRTAVETITERLHEVTSLAEDLDQTLRTAQRDCAMAGSGGDVLKGIEVTVTGEDDSGGEWNTVGVEIHHPSSTSRSPHLLAADYKSDDEFLTASDCTPIVQHSRSSSYNTISDCDQQFAPWWQYGAEDAKDGIAKEKMVLAVGLPELPLPDDVLKPSPEVPPGKIAREVTETTHIRVQQVHTMGVKSFVLTSETVRDNKTLDPAIKPQEYIHVQTTISQQQHLPKDRISPIPIPIEIVKTEISKSPKSQLIDDSDGFEKKLKECGDWIQLKFLEVEPELTSLGDTLEEALVLQRAHDEVLRQLQNKQSPVEELLRQADKLISLQQPKAEVYAAMAESLARAWNDVNAHLGLRKQILDLNVQYHTIAKEFFSRNDALEASCKDTLVPVEIDAVKKFLTNIHDLRRGVLEALMGALQTGNSIIAKLQELGNKGTLDSRPDKIRPSVNKAIAQVQRWMDDLHIKRQVLEATFIRRKSQLEQCLALAILAADLRELDDGLQSRKELLRSTDQLGDSAASADLLLHEHLQLLADAKQLQDRSVKITKATEQLVSSGCFAGEEATKQAYAILEAVSEYITAVQQRGDLLERAIQFFKSAQEANTLLDQIQSTLSTIMLPPTSTQLIQLHSDSAKAIDSVTGPVLEEGHSLLTVNASTEGIRRVVEELENRKIQLDGMCTAHKEEVQRVQRAHNDFLIKEEELQGWLRGVAEAFIDRHRNMGNNAQTSHDFIGLHSELLADLQTKGIDINTLLLTLPPIIEHLADHQRTNVDHKVESLHERWMSLKNLLEKRVSFATPYAKFHRDAEALNREIDEWEKGLREKGEEGDVRENTVIAMERKWEEMGKLYRYVKEQGLMFISEANKPSATSVKLSIVPAIGCVQNTLDALARRQITVTGQWQTWQTDVLELREVKRNLDISMQECTQIIQLVAVIDTNLYPVISTSIIDANAILTNIKLRQQHCIEDLQNVRKNVDTRLQTTSELIAKTLKVDESSLNVKNKLLEMKEKLQQDHQNYSGLTNEIIKYFGFVVDLIEHINELGANINEIGLPTEAVRLDRLIQEHEMAKETILKVIKTRQNDVEKLVDHIKQQEPPAAAQQDIDKIQQVLATVKENWEVDWLRKRDLLNSHKRLCQFDSDLQDINYTIDELSNRVGEIKGRFGESLSEARSNSNAFGQFEKTCDVIEQRITAFVKTGQELLKEKHVQSPHIERQIAALIKRWNDFKNLVKDTRRLIDLSIKYFDLILQADNWFQEGNDLLAHIARETAFVKKPEEAQRLLDEIEVFLKPGELKQNERIAEISGIATELFGDVNKHSVNKVLWENREIMSSFNALSHDLSNLAAQLAQAQEAQRLAELEAEKVKAAETAAKLIEESVIKQKIEMEEMRRTPVVMEYPREERKEQIRMEIVEMEEKAILMESPMFVQPLTNEIIDEGQRFTFTCYVSGSPQPIIAWHKAGVCIQNNPDYATTYDHRTGKCTLTIDETFAEDSASYMCKAISAAGTAETSARLEIRELLPVEEDVSMILVPPTFVRVLQPMTAQEGSDFILSCLVQGNPLPTVQWFKNNECIDNSNEYSITYNNGEGVVRFDRIKLIDKGEYTCKANNAVGSAQSMASLNVLPVVPTESPAFTVPLSNVMARAGQKIKLESEMTGVPTPDVQWSHNGKIINATSFTHEIKLFRDGNKATLIIAEAFPKDAGTYTVTATNLVGSVSSTSTVLVKGRLPTETSDSELASDMEPVKPSISVSLKDVSINEGNRVRLDCVIVGQPEPEVIWYHNDCPVKESADFQLLFHGDRCSLIIKEVLPEDAGKYKVVALNSAGEASSQCTLSVTPLLKEAATKDDESYEIPGIAPKFVKLLSDILIAEGEPVVLEAIVTAEPRPDVIWYLNNQIITPTDHVQITHDEQGNLRLEINNILPEDRGVYTVKASNPCGDAKCFAQLIVKSIKQPPEAIKVHEENKTAPVFKESFTDQSIFAQNSIKFECKVFAKPASKVRWLFNDQPVSGKNFLVSTSGDRQILTIPEVSLENAGKITCVAENEVGKATCTANLKVQSVTDLTLPHLEKSLQDITIQQQPFGGGLFKEVKHFSESNFSVKREVHVESTQSSMSKTMTSNGAEPIIEEHKVIASSEKHLKQINQEAPEVRESAKMQEYHKFGKEPAIVQGESSSSTVINQEKALAITASPKKTRPPKFVTPVIGKIVDQGADVILEGILDGSPSPQVSWTKNGLDFNTSEHAKITYAHNCARIEIKNVGIQDAGRYTCTAINEAGKAISTSDLVVRKNVFPPVFGRRLQAQVIKKCERVSMEVEVTGTPDPTVTWFKDGIPIYDILHDGFKIKSQGNCHTLVLEKANNCHTGKYMVRAVNSGGEAQSIADIAVYEPTPDTMIEVVKSVVFEDVEKHESLATSSDQVSSSITSRTSPLPKIPISQSPFPIPLQAPLETVHTEISQHVEQTVRQETQKFTLEHTAPEFDMKPMRQLPAEIIDPTNFRPASFIAQPEEESIQTSSITKQSSLDFFVKKMKEAEEPVKVVKEVPKIIPIKQELYTKFEEIGTSTKPEPIQPVTEISTYTPYQQVSQDYAYQIQKQIEEEFILAPEPPAQIYFARQPELPPIVTDIKQQKIHKFEEKRIVDVPSLKSIIAESTGQETYQTKLTSLPKFEPISLPEFTSPEILKPVTQQTVETVSQYSKFTEHKQVPIERPRTEGIIMEKTWAHKHAESNIQKSWPPPQIEEVIPTITPTWSAQSTLEKKWSPSQQSAQESKRVASETKVEEIVKTIPGSSYSKTEYSMETAEIIPSYVPHYIAHVSHSANVHEQKQIITVQTQVKKSEGQFMEKGAKQFESVKFLQKIAAPPILETIRPISVQDITDEVYLEPGPPPEIAFAEPPKARKLSYVETIEQHLEKNLVHVPTRVLPGAVRTVPPPLPPKKELPIAPPIPAKSILKTQKEKVSFEHKFERFPELEPFPFMPQPEIQKAIRLAPPPTPSKFVKGKFTDSDYESDFEATRISSKWKTSASDNEELGFRHVNAPKGSVTTRSKSQDRDAVPPSQFEKPAETQGIARPFIDFNQAKQLRIESQISQKKTVHKHFTKTASHHEIKKPVPLPAIKPGSPPEYVVSPEPKPKPQSPKTKPKTVIDGYMADTDEPFTLRQEKKLITKSEFREEHRHVQQSQHSIAVPQKIPPSLTQSKTQVHKFSQHKKHVSSSTASTKELVSTPIISVSASEKITPPKPLEPFPFHTDAPRPKKPRVPPPPSPSRFVKGEFKESDYESDYDSRITSTWGADSNSTFKPVRPVLTPVYKLDRHRSPTPPTIFDKPAQVTGITRPKFQPIEKPVNKTVALDDIIKPVAFKQQVPLVEQRIVKIQPGSPPEIAFAPPPKSTQYYRSTTSAPYHNAVQTETSNVMHFNESTERAHRTMSVQQTTKVIKFGQQQQQQQRGSRITEKLEPFPFKPEPVRQRRSSAPPPNVPSKFIPGEFRESDYESEVESTRIKSTWIPGGSDTEEPHYRRVCAPASSRSLSVPSRQDQIQSPLEFDRMPTQSQSYVSSVSKRFTDDRSQSSAISTIKPGSPPEYAITSTGQQQQHITKSTATKIASKHMDSMTQSFKSKAQQFVTDIMEDVTKKKQEKNGDPILKPRDDTDAQVYREETRAADYGTKHVDPDTGLIYFKYDFGYEFGIVLPGESQSGTIPSPPKTVIQPPKRQQSIEMPVLHETKKPKQNGAIPSYKSSNKGSAPLWKPSYSFEGKKGVKWEPTSESEMSEYEQEVKKGGRWSSCSPVSISPSPSPYGAVSSGKEDLTSGQNTPAYIHPSQRRAPSFITPLKDIAVVCGQSARFECIVQSELPLSVLWSKDGRILQNSKDYQIFFKNGVCRLTISKTYPEDAGTYVCTAANIIGSSGSTAMLQVPGVPSHMYGTYRQLTIDQKYTDETIPRYKRPSSPIKYGGKSNGVQLDNTKLHKF